MKRQAAAAAAVEEAQKQKKMRKPKVTKKKKKKDPNEPQKYDICVIIFRVKHSDVSIMELANIYMTESNV